MTRQHISMLAGALLVAAPFAAQASVGGFQQDPNIYSQDYWARAGIGTNCDARFNNGASCPAQDNQGVAAGQGANNSGAQGVNGQM